MVLVLTEPSVEGPAFAPACERSREQKMDIVGCVKNSSFMVCRALHCHD